MGDDLHGYARRLRQDDLDLQWFPTGQRQRSDGVALHRQDVALGRPCLPDRGGVLAPIVADAVDLEEGLPAALLLRRNDRGVDPSLGIAREGPVENWDRRL